MRQSRNVMLVGTVAISTIVGCAADRATGARRDSATQLAITGASGSLQNPCWVPGPRLAFTDFRTRYNVGPSTVSLVDATGGIATALTPGATDEVNMPGSCFEPVGARIAYTSDQTATGHDEVFVVPITGGAAIQVTDRPTDRTFEPTFAPDGASIVFESHTLARDDDGTLFKIRSDGTELTQLTTLAVVSNARQPVWSPTGDKIVFQGPGTSAAFDLFTIAPDGTGLTNVTRSAAEETDASFSPDGRFILYSSNEGGLELANLFAIPVNGGTSIRITESDSYDGAPAWSPDGATIAFESFPGDPDDSAGTRLFVVSAPIL